MIKLCQITVNDPIIIVLDQNEFSETYILSNGHETCQSYNDQIIMKYIYTCVNTYGLELSSEYFPACYLDKL